MSADPCPSCNSAMAADQRYCLACGERRAEARLDFVEILRGPRGIMPAVAGVPVSAATDPDAARGRLNTTVVASIGCLLLAMGIGVLIGRSGNRDPVAPPASAPAAQVIRIQGGGTAAAGSSTASAPSSKKKRAKKAASSVATAKSAADSKATNPALKQLSNTSGAAYQKQSQKLPKVISTGGKAPPVDKSKPAGGGTGFQSIG